MKLRQFDLLKLETVKMISTSVLYGYFYCLILFYATFMPL